MIETHAYKSTQLNAWYKLTLEHEDNPQKPILKEGVVAIHKVKIDTTQQLDIDELEKNKYELEEVTGEDYKQLTYMLIREVDADIIQFKTFFPEFVHAFNRVSILGVSDTTEKDRAILQRESLLFDKYAHFLDIHQILNRALRLQR